MNLTWHIVLKDFRRLRIPILVWMLSFVAQFLVGARLMSGAVTTSNAFLSAQLSCQVLNLVQLVVGFMLIPEVILDDPLVGSRSFWPTRPISGGRLLGAKLIACALLFGLLPNLVSLPWWLYCGYGAGEIWRAAASSFGFESALLVIGLLVASVSSNLSRFIGWSVLLIVGLGLSFLTLVTPAGTHLFFHGMDQMVGSEVNWARLVSFCWIAYPAAALVIFNQFLTRRIGRSLVLLACILVLLAVDVTWWPLGPTSHPRAAGIAESRPELDRRVVVQRTEGPMLHVDGDSAKSSDAYLFGALSVKDAPPEMLLKFDPPVLSLAWPDGTSSRMEGRMPGMLSWKLPSPSQMKLVVPYKGESEATWEKTPWYRNSVKEGKPKTFAEIYGKGPANHSWDYYFEVSRTVGSRMLTEPSSCTLELQGSYLQPKLTAEVPMEKGNGWSAGSDGFRIVSCGWNEQAHMYVALLVERRATIRQFSRFPVDFVDLADASFVAINRAKGDSAVSRGAGNYAPLVRIATVQIAWGSVTFTGPDSEEMGQEWVDGHWSGPDMKDWFTGITLGRVTESVEGGFSRKVPIEKFTAALDTFSKAP